ncbi:MAG: cysteine hydrolase family protein [Desulfobaccales bacterium]
MKSALLLIDIQNDYFPGGAMELVDMTRAAAHAGEALAAFRQAGQPRFHVQHIALGPGAAFFRPDTAGVEIHASVRPLPGEPLIRKHYPNAFRDTGLLAALQSAGIEELVICGAMSHMCVDATTRAAFDYGLACTVIHDACASRDLVFKGQTIPAAHVHGAFMAALGMRYARVWSLEELLKSFQEISS